MRLIEVSEFILIEGVKKLILTLHLLGVLMYNRGENVEPINDVQKIPITEYRPVWFICKLKWACICVGCVAAVHCLNNQFECQLFCNIDQ